MSNDEKPKRKNDEDGTWTEEIEIAGKDLVDYVKKLVEQGNVRRLIIRKQDDTVLLEIPLTQAVVVGGLASLLMPVFAALGAMAALVAKVKVEIVRFVDEEEDETSTTGKRKTRISIESDEEA